MAAVHAPLADRCGLAFIGEYAHARNVDAARWLVHEIMPLVWRGARGAMSDRWQQHAGRATPGAGGPTCRVLGRVDNLSEVFERVRLTVAPLRFGAGLKDKVLRSMAAGLPCIGTPEAFSGMQELPTTITGHARRDNASELATAIVRMHLDEAANAELRQGQSDVFRAAFYNQSRIDALMLELAQPAVNNATNQGRFHDQG